ncbi:hypothetical protein GCM10027020_15590 [Nocardioides salsibiostraticola]
MLQIAHLILQPLQAFTDHRMIGRPGLDLGSLGVVHLGTTHARLLVHLQSTLESALDHPSGVAEEDTDAEGDEDAEREEQGGELVHDPMVTTATDSADDHAENGRTDRPAGSAGGG